jgi:hypothetical protein
MMSLMVMGAFAVPSHAFQMADYWALNEGNVWIFDRDVFVMGTDSHPFSHFTGRPLLQAHGFCDYQGYVYSGPEGVLLVGMYTPDTQQFIDLSATPVKLSNADMVIGDSVTSAFSAGVIDENPISFTVTLEAVQTVTVPAGTYSDALRLKILVNDGTGTYIEKVWLAKGVGPVMMYRASETNGTAGCFFTCGSLGCCDNTVEQRYIKLNSFIKGRTSYVYYIPHITNGSSDWTDYLQANNTGGSDGAFTLTLYAGGASVYSTDVSLAGYDQTKIDLKAASASAQTGMVTCSDDAIHFRYSTENVGGGVVEFDLPSTLYSGIGLYYSDFTPTITVKGAAIANFSASTITVTIRVIGNGTSRTSTKQIGPMGKIIGISTQWFPELSFDDVKALAVTSNSASLCGFVISGDTSLSHLLFTPASALGQLPAN